MPILKNIVDEKGVQTEFHRILSYMVDVDTQKVLVCIGSYIDESVYNQEQENRKKADRWEQIGQRMGEIADLVETETDESKKEELKKEDIFEKRSSLIFKKTHVMSEIKGSVSRKVLAYNISERWIDKVSEPTLETVELALIKEEPFYQGKIIE